MGVRIVIADDHQVVRRGLRAILEAQPGWKVCGEASDGREVLEMARQLKPDVVVLDISMPELNGLMVAKQILKMLPRTEVVILTVHDSDQMAREVLVAGVRGYVLKSDAERDLVAAVKAVRAHKPFFTTKVSEMVLEGYLKGRPQWDEQRVVRDRLTAREREVVQLISEGKTNKEIAASLHISINTAEAHRANILNKLDAESFTEVIRYAIRNRIVQP